MERQCGSCACAKRFFAAHDGSGALDHVECTNHDHVKWLDSQNLTIAYSSEMERQGYVKLWRLERVARRDYGCPHWLSREGESAVECERQSKDNG